MQSKISEKHMRWANFLSMFHFQIVHVEGKKMQMHYQETSGFSCNHRIS